MFESSPIKSPSSRFELLGPAISGGVVFLLPFLLYLRTLCPTFFPGDSAELSAAAWCLGVPHPTGYPLYMVLGWIVQHLGLGSPIFATNLLTAFFGALAAVGAYRLQIALWLILAPTTRDALCLPCRLIAVSVALACAGSATWWDQSTLTDVHSLTLVFLTWTWALGLHIIRRPARRKLLALALLSGTGFLNHQIFLITLPLSALALAAYWRWHTRPVQPVTEEPADTELTTSSETSRLTPDASHTPPCLTYRDPHPKKTLLLAVALFLLPLLGYVYLPLRAAAQPPINAGNPRGLSGLFDHLTGKQYRQTRVLTNERGIRLQGDEISTHLKNRLTSIARWMGEQHVAPVRAETLDSLSEDRRATVLARAPLLALITSLLALAGLYALANRAPLAAAGLAGGYLLNLAIVLTYTIPDIEPYQIPLWLLTLQLAAVAPTAIVDRVALTSASGTPPTEASRLRRLYGTSAALLALAVFGVVKHYDPSLQINKSENQDAYLYADQLMEILPPNATVFTTGDYDIYPLWYVQTCENRRPDVAVIGANFLFSNWYTAMLRVNLPEGVKTFISSEPTPNSDRWLVALLGGAVAPQLQAGRPVYFTAYPGTEQLDLIRRYSQFVLQPQFQFPGTTPFGPEPPLILYQLTDPKNFAPRAIEVFNQSGNFPLAQAWMVEGEKSVPQFTTP
jgi:hypothetical protein